MFVRNPGKSSRFSTVPWPRRRTSPENIGSEREGRVQVGEQDRRSVGSVFVRHPRNSEEVRLVLVRRRDGEIVNVGGARAERKTLRELASRADRAEDLECVGVSRLERLLRHRRSVVADGAVKLGLFVDE